MNDALHLLRSHLEAALISQLTDVSASALSYARDIVPYGDGRDGGHLRNCLSARVFHQGGCFTAAIEARNPHALYVELGTSCMRAQPYLRPALHAHRQYFLQALSSLPV